MSGVKLTLESLPRVRGGALSVAVNQALIAAIHDCRDRPSLKKARTVVLKIQIAPTEGETEFDDADVVFDLSRSFPAKSLPVRMTDNGEGLTFQPMAADNPHQKTLMSDLDDDSEAE